MGSAEFHFSGLTMGLNIEQFLRGEEALKGLGLVSNKFSEHGRVGWGWALRVEQFTWAQGPFGGSRQQ